MFCKKCGKDIDIKNKVCPECGEDTDFLKGIDGDEKLEHLDAFEREINTAFNNIPAETTAEEVKYEDISSYKTPAEERKVIRETRRTTAPRRRTRATETDTYEESGNTWKILATVCAVIILVCLIIIISVSCGSKTSTGETTQTTAPVTTTVLTTTETTTVATTEKPVEEYISTAVVDDANAIEAVQGFYSNMEAACAGDDIEAFKEFFTASYTDEEIQSIYNQYHSQCTAYQTFIPGITTTVSSEKYIYTYIAATTNLDTLDYVENTFVLSSEGGAFKLDKSEGATAYMAQAPSKLSQ